MYILNFIELQLTFNERHLFKVYNLKSSDITVHLQDHHHYQDGEHTHHPQMFSLASLYLNTLSYISHHPSYLPTTPKESLV